MSPNPPATPSFDWIPFYQELAGKLIAFRARQHELIQFLLDCKEAGLTVTPLNDKDKTGRQFLLTEIDPFTFFGCFNRGTVWANRIEILKAAKTRFDVQAPVPTDFSGLPILNNQRSWLFAYQFERDPADIDHLWKVFRLALNDNPMGDPDFATAFDEALTVRNTNVNLTMGLFWIRPHVFLNIDSVNRSYYLIKLPAKGLSFQFYAQVLEQVRQAHGGNFPALSYQAWIASITPPPPPPEVDYWMVGASWDGQDPPDQTPRFLADGIWESGYGERYADLIRSMKVGDRIAIKHYFVQRNGLPFDSKGHSVGVMRIKAVGTIVANPGDGQRVEVEWDQQDPQTRVWYFYTNSVGVWRLRKDDHYSKQLIRFSFEGASQDFDYFLSRWWAKEPNPEPLPQAPYGIVDVVADGVFLTEGEIETCLRRWKTKKNIILQGAPGVGKTFVAKRLAYALLEEKDDARITVVQFHPSYSYEDLIRGFRPNGEAGKFHLTDGPFLQVRQLAEDNPDLNYVLIVDEINRGNVSQVFGELMMLLEADKRGKSYSVSPLYRKSPGELLHVPANLYVIGTMNIADRSLALVDYALRRRFAFFTLEPRYASSLFRDWLLDRGMSNALVQLISDRMSALNRQIEDDPQLGPAFRIGHSFFCPAGRDFSLLDENWYREIVDTEIRPLLDEYWHDDPKKASDAADKL